jgi:hypothetical protein
MIFCKTFHFDNQTMLSIDSLIGSTFRISNTILVFEIDFEFLNKIEIEAHL